MSSRGLQRVCVHHAPARGRPQCACHPKAQALTVTTDVEEAVQERLQRISENDFTRVGKDAECRGASIAPAHACCAVGPHYRRAKCR
jgi:hypothetical protein